MHLLTIDFETFWDADYTLNKLSTEEYVRDPRFLAHGASVSYGDGPARWIDGPDLPAFFARVPWYDTAVLCQNTAFDGLILSWHYGVVPAMYLDTLAMARLVLRRTKHNLATLSRRLGLKPKGSALHLTKGLRELPPLVREALIEYAIDDNDITRGVFKQLRAHVPFDELFVIDLTIRLFTQPRLLLNRKAARSLLARVLRKKRSALQRLGVTKEQLSSTPKFAALLEERFGIEVEYKKGKPDKDGNPRFLPALAKTDAFMKSLEEHEDPDVQAVASLRLNIKSTLEETRLRRLLAMHERGPLPVFLNYAGAHTIRWSGGDKVNWQNLPRATPDKPAELRKCIMAPPGYVLVVVDLSQIEARVLLALAGQLDKLELFASGDPYSAMAAAIYGHPINKKDNPLERQLGKVIVLASGYGMGGRKLRAILRIGAMGAPVMLIEIETANGWITIYRKEHPMVVAYWNQAEAALELLAGGAEAQPWGPFMIDKGMLWHPNGVSLDYTGLVRVDGEWNMVDRDGKVMVNQFGYPIRLYGGMMTENVVQWASREILKEGMIRMRRSGALQRWPLVMTTHDENVCLAPEREAEECQRVMIEHMTKRPSWLPHLPLAAEGGFDVCYSK